MSNKDRPPVWWWNIGSVAFNMIPYMSDLFFLDYKAEAAKEIRYRRGEALEEGVLPDRLLFDKDRDGAQIDPLPPAFYSAVYFVVNGAVHDLLMQFDLGGAVLHPVDLFQIDHTTRVEGRFYILQIMARKQGFEPEHSQNWKKYNLEPPAPIGDLSFRTTDDDAKVNLSACDGADLWCDTQLASAIFISNRLYQALKEANLLGAARTVRCAVVDLH